MNCPKCGVATTINSAFCTNCGTPLNQNGSYDKPEDYGLKSKLSMWNVAKIKNPQQYGGYSKPIFILLYFISLIWMIGLILFVVNIKSNSIIKKYQAKVFLSGAVFGFILMLMTVSNNDVNNKRASNDNKQIKSTQGNNRLNVETQNNYKSDQDFSTCIKDCKYKVMESIVGKSFTASPTQRLVKGANGMIAGFKFYDEESRLSGFNVKTPETFTVIRRIEKDFVDMYEVKFESGKVGYVSESEFYSLSDGPDVYKDKDKCYGICNSSK